MRFPLWTARALRASDVRAVLLGWTVAAAAVIGSGCGDFFAAVGQAVDTDGDGLSDRREQRLGTSPYLPDSDFDGLTDGEEIEAGTSPLARDSDADGLDDRHDGRQDPPAARGGSVSSGNDLEPNDTFDSAVGADDPGQTRWSLEGRIDRRGDVDVFDLGSRTRGERIVVDLLRQEGTLRAVAALFAADGSIMDSGRDPFVRNGPDVTRMIDLTLRRSSLRVYLALTHPAENVALGPYRVEVGVEPATEVPRPAGQALLLDFDGGALDVPILGLTRIDPFDASAVASAYAGSETFLRQVIVETVTDNFTGFAVTVYADEAEVPPDVELSRVLLGSFSSTALGASQGVDFYNADRCDDGVVFTESFRPVVFGFTPTAEALGVAIGNVAAHEAGHLLGLSHVTDPAAVMDELSPGVHLLTDQEFKRAPLSASVFPIGAQDAPRLLADTVGVDPAETAP